MEIPVLVEPIVGNKPRFRSQAGEPWHASAEATTAEEALAHVQQIVRARMSAGARMMMIQLDDSSNPWKSISGALPDDTTTQAWEEAMQDYRKEINRQDPVS